ncbi:hypothetical protein PR001_g16717 [Phytophthora rubi]|uniref:Pectate lyase n=1 Tax=Phytophthora rubi TaxID=129364 RepID=A0A6A3KSY7_9STRA|nr:hypothetical protein PR002_g17443 [Phytophthora rubi]KAE9008365.1 hypothetical protein PR001_g16717 [Phytophthora rubi]
MFSVFPTLTVFTVFTTGTSGNVWCEDHTCVRGVLRARVQLQGARFANGRNANLFCQSTGVVRQVSEAKNQATVPTAKPSSCIGGLLTWRGV